MFSVKPKLTKIIIHLQIGLEIALFFDFSFDFGFYGISTIVGYLIPNLLYAYILNIYDWFKWFQVLDVSHQFN